jgi:hypothetical protein
MVMMVVVVVTTTCWGISSNGGSSGFGFEQFVELPATAKTIASFSVSLLRESASGASARMGDGAD